MIIGDMRKKQQEFFKRRHLYREHKEKIAILKMRYKLDYLKAKHILLDVLDGETAKILFPDEKYLAYLEKDKK